MSLSIAHYQATSMRRFLMGTSKTTTSNTNQPPSSMPVAPPPLSKPASMDSTLFQVLNSLFFLFFFLNFILFVFGWKCRALENHRCWRALLVVIFFPGDQVSQGCSGGSSSVVFLFLESGKMINGWVSWWFLLYFGWISVKYVVCLRRSVELRKKHSLIFTVNLSL